MKYPSIEHDHHQEHHPNQYPKVYIFLITIKALQRKNISFANSMLKILINGFKRVRDGDNGG